MIYFLSDAHLGSLVMEDPEAHQEKFVSLLDRMTEDASAIYLLGDIFDFWYEFSYGEKGKPKGFDKVLDALRRAAARCEVHFFVGNHDMWTFGWLEKQTGIHVHYDPECVTLCGKTCFLGHGDGLGSENKRFLRLRRVFRNPVLQFMFRFVPPKWGNRFGYNWAASSRRKELASPEGYKGEHNESLVRFAKQQEAIRHADYYIFGHRHIELHLLLPTRAQLFILGDFFRQYTYAKMDEAGVVSLEVLED